MREQTSGRVDQGTGAHAGHQRDGGALATDPVQLAVVVELRACALAAGIYQHVKWWSVVEGMLGLYNQSLGALH